MVQNMTQAGTDAGRQEVAQAGDIEENVVDSQTFKPIWSEKGKNSEVYWAGHGIENRETNVGRLYLDLKTTPDGGTTINDATGKCRFVVYEDADRDYLKAVGPTFSLSDLRDAVSDGRFDRPMLPTHNPGAAQDEHIALEVKVDSSLDGETVYNDTTAAHLPYTALRV